MSEHTLSKLKKKLAANTDYQLEVTEHALIIKNDSSIEAFLVISGKQILIEVLLHPVSKTQSQDELNEKILSSHQYMPLTNICISDHGGERYYVAFGSLYSGSRYQEIQMEIDTLFVNTEEALQTMEPYFIK